MFAPDSNTTADFAVALLIHYSFDLGGYTAGELLDRWLNNYPASWLRLAVIEALYQGRYKAISVEQILAVWKRREQALYHFNHEFERLIWGNFPQMLTGQPYTRAAASPPIQDQELGVPTQWGNGAVGREESSDYRRPIEQFTPDSDRSDFYTKLKAIAKHSGNTPS